MTHLYSTTDVGERLESLRPALMRIPHPPALDEPEDLVQEAFVRALTHPEVDPEKLQGWLRTVVRNLAYDAVRRDRSADAATARLARAEVLEPDPAEAVAEQDLAKVAADWAGDLPRRQREVLYGVAEGRSIAEVARSQGLSLRAAEGHLRRARETLRRRMKA